MDAWEIASRLGKRFTKKTVVRRDLEVTALGADRHVRLSMAEFVPDRLSRTGHSLRWTVTDRNVSTMRELARALNDACDFVEASNPEWAQHAR